MSAVEDVLAGRGVVVTGAGRGIGRALAARAAAEGARVVVNDLDADAAHEAGRQIGATAVVAGDAASAEGAAVLVQQAVHALGRVDVLFANAGIDGALGDGGDSLQAPDEVWDRVLDVNVRAHVRLARDLVPRWLEDGGAAGSWSPRRPPGCCP